MTSVIEVLSSIERGRLSAGKAEHANLEFKTEKPSAKETFQDLAEAAVCFANGSGGSIVLGVADDRLGADAFVGASLDAVLLRSKIHELTRPPLTTAVRELEWSGTRLLQIDVAEGLDVYSTGRGLFTRRWTDTCLPMQPAEVARLTEERSGADWSSQDSGRDLSELDGRAMHMMRDLLRSSGDSSKERLAELRGRSLLTELGLLTEAGRLTRAADLVLCAPADGSDHDIVVYQHRPTQSGEADQVRRWSAPLLVAFSETLATITARVGTIPITTARGQQIAIEDYPLRAVREALANGMIHGELRERMPLRIEHSPESLIVQSPGPLVSGITPDNILTHGSRPRFRLLASTMRVLGLAEELGQGVDRMFREMVRSGRSTPSVGVSTPPGAETTVAFRGGPPNVRLAKFVADLPEPERSDTDALLIANLLCQKRTTAAREVALVIQRDHDEAEGVLRRLAHGESMMIEPTAGTANRRFPRYRFTGSSLAALGSAAVYSRRDLSQSDRKVVDHVREYETINNATMQRLFDVDVYAARDLLRDLVGREVLVRVSHQTRGTAVKYGRGPKFPSSATPKRRIEGS